MITRCVGVAVPFRSVFHSVPPFSHVRYPYIQLKEKGLKPCSITSILNTSCQVVITSFVLRFLHCIHAVTKEAVQYEMEFFAATTDLWISAAMKPYLSFSIHSIDRSWNLKSSCFRSQSMPEDHTVVNNSESITELLQYWNLNLSKLVALTTDSGGNIKLACQLGGWTHFSCFGQYFDLLLK